MRPLTLLFLLIGLIAACDAGAGSDDPTVVGPAEAVVELGVDGTAALPGRGLSIRLLAVTDDSRCAAGLQCVWEGDAVAVLEIRHDDTTSVARLHVNAHGAERPGHVGVAGHRIELVGLSPPPRAEAAIPQSEYRVELRVGEGAP